MSERDELIAKARDLDRRLPEGPWQVEGVSGGQADIADNRGNWIATIRKDFDGTDDPLIIELRTLLPALADLAESEGRRADEAEKKLERIVNPPIKSLEVKDGGLSCSLDGPEMARIIATSFWDMLTENKADNYVEMTFAAPEKPLKKVIVIVRKVFGKTPHDLRVQAEAERDAALAEIAALKGQVESMRPVVEAVRELLAAKVAMLSAISADFMSEARLKYLRKLSKVESLDLPPKEQP